MTRSRVMLVGASSQIGLFAIPRLLAAGFHVLAVSRRGRPQYVPTLEPLEWLTQEQAVQGARDCHYLLSAGPLEISQSLLREVSSIHTAVLFSSSSVISKRDSADRAERRQVRQMLAAESELRSMADQGSVKLVIFRPTLVYGCGLDTNITLLAHWIRRRGYLPVNGKAEGLRQPVHADDLASVAVGALRSDIELPRVLMLAGGSTISYADMARQIFTALDKPARLLGLPQWLMVLLLRLASLLGLVADVNSEMVRRQRRDLVFDDREARRLLNYSPRPFAPDAADFSVPDFCKSSCDQD